MKLRLKELREKAYLSQSELAIAAGLSKSAIVKLEAGRVEKPYGRTLRRLAAALDVPVAELIISD